MDISKHIIEIRESKKISPSEIADRLEIERTNYYRLEKKGDKLTIEQLKKIAEALGVHYLELLGEFPSIDNAENLKLQAEVLELRINIKRYETVIDVMMKTSMFIHQSGSMEVKADGSNGEVSIKMKAPSEDSKEKFGKEMSELYEENQVEDAFEFLEKKQMKALNM